LIADSEAGRTIHQLTREKPARRVQQ
jgi:hypothetical protein